MHPAFENRPLVVLSNNDGCAISRSNEAKALGIKMGIPWYQIQHLTQSHGLIALSANFDLYGDLSQRLMNILGQFTSGQDIYSIDEAFLDLTCNRESGRTIGHQIQQRVLQWTGLPTSIGIGQSHTLAKLANHLAKSIPRLQGVCDLSTLDQPALQRAIRHVPVEKVWGIGKKLSQQLHALGIYTAADLAQSPQHFIRARFSVTLAKTALELQGISCMKWQETPSPKQQIMCSRSFGNDVYSLSDLSEAISTFTGVAAQKLRQQKSKTSSIYIFIRTTRYRQTKQYATSATQQLPYACDDTISLTKAALQGLKKIYQPGYPYATAGVCLLDISNQHNSTLALEPFLPRSAHTERLMQTMDTINQRFGRTTLQLGSSLTKDNAPWKMRQQHMTPAYTSDWTQIITIWR